MQGSAHRPGGRQQSGGRQGDSPGIPSLPAWVPHLVSRESVRRLRSEQRVAQARGAGCFQLPSGCRHPASFHRDGDQICSLTSWLMVTVTWRIGRQVGSHTGHSPKTQLLYRVPGSPSTLPVLALPGLPPTGHQPTVRSSHVSGMPGSGDRRASPEHLRTTLVHNHFPHPIRSLHPALRPQRLHG